MAHGKMSVAFSRMFLISSTLVGLSGSPGNAADKPDLILTRSTVFKWLTQDDKLATYGIDDLGPIRSKKKFEQGEDVFRARRSLFFKKMQIVRGCDTKRNVLVYMVYSDKLIEGSPKNSTSSVPVMPWGAGDQAQKCADWIG
jgi:CreA protein